MSSSVSWPILIAHVMSSRSDVFNIDRGKLWGYDLPRVGAGLQAIEAAERRLGRTLDEQYREFLSYADGWPHVFQNAHVLGTSELGAGRLWNEAVGMLREIAEESPDLPDEAATSLNWMPIAIDEEAPGLFIQGDRTRTSPVIWFSAGALGERWEDFESFLLGLLELNRRDADALANDPAMREALARIPDPPRSPPHSSS